MVAEAPRPVGVHRYDRVPATSEQLESLLDRARGWSFEFIRENADSAIDSDICNHLELSLISAAELGASDKELARFFDDYVPRWPLEPLPPLKRPIDRGNWHLYLGDHRREVEYREFFRGEVASLGWEAAVRRYLPHLIYGPGAAAFHAMIRLSYAVLRQDAVEVAAGLAYWAIVTVKFPHPERGQAFTERPAEALKRMRDDPVLRVKEHGGIGLWERMNLMGHEPEFSPVMDWLSVQENSIRLIAHDCLALFVETDDLRALHAVTGSQAMRELLPFLEPADRITATRYLWQAVASVYHLMGFLEPTPDDKLDELRRLPCPTWQEINSAARASLEEHDLKLVFVLEEEWLSYGDPLYRVAAANRMRLIDLPKTPVPVESPSELAAEGE